MEQRALGSQGLDVSILGLGCMALSEFYGAADQAESLATIHRALDLGITFLDTADMYGPFKNEELLGRALKGHRDQVVLATKFGIVRSATDPAVRGVSGRPDYVKQSCDGSLQRLGVDHIDLYYQHRVDATVPIPGTTRRAHLKENVTAMGVELTPGDREELASALPPGAASGLRHPEAGMRALSL